MRRLARQFTQSFTTSFTRTLAWCVPIGLTVLLVSHWVPADAPPEAPVVHQVDVGGHRAVVCVTFHEAITCDWAGWSQ